MAGGKNGGIVSFKISKKILVHMIDYVFETQAMVKIKHFSRSIFKFKRYP